jgi:hypothetical protein
MQDDAAGAAGAGGDAAEDLLGAAIDAAFEEGQDGTARSSKAQQVCFRVVVVVVEHLGCVGHRGPCRGIS